MYVANVFLFNVGNRLPSPLSWTYWYQDNGSLYRLIIDGIHQNMFTAMDGFIETNVLMAFKLCTFYKGCKNEFLFN